MRIQCGLCEKNLASVMCCVDEAALCADCDARTHTARKNHVRVNLLTAPEPPKCDICQEKRGFFFCLEDRALLCRDCDVSIHTANALSCTHKRFLVTGTRVALEERKEEVRKEEVPSPAASSQSSHCSTISSPTSTLQRPRNTTTHVTPDLPKAYSGYTPSCCPPPPPTTTQAFPETSIVSSAPVKSSFSEFLTDAVPGWRVDELLNIVDCNESFNNNSDMAPVKCGDGGVTGDFDWTADLSLFEEQMFALHEVPQFPVAPQMAPPSSRSRHVRNNRSKQDMYTSLPHNVYGDAFIVPEIRMPSGPLPFPKRYKRDLHH